MTAPLSLLDTWTTAPPTRITVIGAGYLGATHAACMAELGYEVLALDTDEAKLDALADGRAPFYEPGLDEMLARNVALGRLRFTSSYADVARFGDVHFLCVGTPQQPDGGAADLRQVQAAVEALAPLLRRPALVVGKSTVPVGTAGRLAVRLRTLAPAGDRVELAWNPEFLRESQGIADTLRPDRIVFGVTSAAAEQRLRAVFAPVIAQGIPVVTTDLETAELVKVAANAFLATKISFINAVAEVCEAVGADALQLSAALGHDARIGSAFLHPGLGFGGGCLGKDLRAFQARADELGVGDSLAFLADVDAVNQRRRDRVVDLAADLLGGSLVGARVAVLGAAFKPDSDDVRDSPSLAVAVGLEAAGADVRVFDPEAMRNAAEVAPHLTYARSALDAATDADVVLLLTEWAEFVHADPAAFAAVVARRHIVDGRNVLDREAWTAAGWEFRAPGRPAGRTVETLAEV